MVISIPKCPGHSFPHMGPISFENQAPNLGMGLAPAWPFPCSMFCGIGTYLFKSWQRSREFGDLTFGYVAQY